MAGVQEVVSAILNNQQFAEMVANMRSQPQQSQSQPPPSHQSQSSVISPSHQSQSSVTSPSASANVSETDTRTRFTAVRDEFTHVFRRGGTFSQPWNVQRQRGRGKRRNDAPIFKPKIRTINKDIILLKYPDTREVPRGYDRTELCESGQIISAFTIRRNWSKGELIENLEEAFSSKLSAMSSIANEPKFTFLIACGKDLVEPVLQQGCELGGEMVASIYKQKALYLLPREEIQRPCFGETDVDMSTTQVVTPVSDAPTLNSPVTFQRGTTVSDAPTHSLPVTFPSGTAMSVTPLSDAAIPSLPVIFPSGTAVSVPPVSGPSTRSSQVTFPRGTTLSVTPLSDAAIPSLPVIFSSGSAVSVPPVSGPSTRSSQVTFPRGTAMSVTPVSDASTLRSPVTFPRGTTLSVTPLSDAAIPSLPVIFPSGTAASEPPVSGPSTCSSQVTFPGGTAMSVTAVSDASTLNSPVTFPSGTAVSVTPVSDALTLSSPVTFPGSSTQDCMNTTMPQDKVVFQFQEMFPAIPIEEIAKAVKSCTVDDFIEEDKLLHMLCQWSPHKDLQEWQECTRDESIYRMDIDRHNITLMMNAMLIYKSPSSSLKKKPMVHFIGEAGIDRGALFNEFTCSVLKCLQKEQMEEGGPLFEGQDGHLLPVASKVHLVNHYFQVFGKALAHSVLHGGPGVSYLSPAIKYVLSRNVCLNDIIEAGIPVQIEDIPDPVLQVLLLKDLDDFSQDDRQCLTVEMEQSGFGYSVINSNTYGAIRQHITVYHVLERRWPQILNIRKGMDELGLFTFLCGSPSVQNISIVFPTEEHLDSSTIIQAIDVGDREAHGDLSTWLKQLLHEVEESKLENITLKDIVAFWTGEERLGGQQLSVSVNDGHLPTTHSCFGNLELPSSVSSFEEFKKSFQIAIDYGRLGFGNV